MRMNGNIDEWLDITATGEVTATGWIDFEATDPDRVEIYVGISQGDKKNQTAVYAEGSVWVDRPNGVKRTTWECPATIDGQAGAFKTGPGAAGAVVTGQDLEPYPWGRDVKLRA